MVAFKKQQPSQEGMVQRQVFRVEDSRVEEPHGEPWAFCICS